jgi:hypothetical protein
VPPVPQAPNGNGRIILQPAAFRFDRTGMSNANLFDVNYFSGREF